MSSLLVVTAFGAEYQTIWEHLTHRETLATRDVAGYAVTRGILQGIPTDLIVTGTGKDFTIDHLSEFLNFRASAPARGAVAVGFCGGLSHSAKLGALSVPDRCIYKTRNFSPSQKLRQSVAKNLYDHDQEFLVGDMLTVEAPVLTIEDRKRLNSETAAVTVDMESAFFAQVCEERKLPWFVFKTVMDDVETKNLDRESLKPGLEVAKAALLKHLGPLLKILKNEWAL